MIQTESMKDVRLTLAQSRRCGWHDGSSYRRIGVCSLRLSARLESGGRGGVSNVVSLSEIYRKKKRKQIEAQYVKFYGLRKEVAKR